METIMKKQLQMETDWLTTRGIKKDKNDTTFMWLNQLKPETSPDATQNNSAGSLHMKCFSPALSS